MKAEFGIVGLAVMGQNLALNVENKGYIVTVYNRTAERTREFMTRSAGRRIIPTYSLEEFMGELAKPRRILVQIAAGAPVDELLGQLLPVLEKGDIVMDGGNSHFGDTDRRAAQGESHGIFYIGLGISGGEHGALHGPSLMAGGPRKAYVQVEEILQRIAAQGPEGPCVGYFGPRSAGHYVKMVHNGIEYAIMETLAEAYDLMKRGLSMSTAEMAAVFASWNRGELSSYLVEITEKILCTPDPETGEPLVEKILDTAQQKGTGKWSTQSAGVYPQPLPSCSGARSSSSFVTS